MKHWACEHLLRVHAMSKRAQCVTNDVKVSTKLTFVFIKEAQSILQKNHNLDQKEWERAARVVESMFG